TFQEADVQAPLSELEGEGQADGAGADDADACVDDLTVGDGTRVGEHRKTLYGRRHARFGLRLRGSGPGGQ
ncbi:MAG: hypothetical protein QOH73_757, partial [Gaiellaceae bacterium]|nr:hypothetical protein [Gaiellaceae bacterium]